MEGEETDVGGLTLTLNGLESHTAYTVSVQVKNGARFNSGLGEPVNVTFTTEAGAVRPEITDVSTNLDTNCDCQLQ